MLVSFFLIYFYLLFDKAETEWNSPALVLCVLLVRQNQIVPLFSWLNKY